MNTKEVVIAAYQRDYSWVRQLNDDIKVTVYRKGNGVLLPNEIKLEPNIGRCVHTFFTHLYNRYDSLADITYFSQDYHLDHVNNYIHLMNSDVEELNKHGIDKIDGSCWFFSTHFNVAIPCNNNGNPHDSGLDLGSVWGELFNVPPPNTYYFTPAGHFVITKEHARSIPRETYRRVIDMLVNRHRGPWEIERLEPYIFVNNYKDLK